MSERYTTTRMPHARPLGAPSVMEGIYDGAELATRSSRPGAYDAMRIPSLEHGRRHEVGTPRPVPAAYMPPAPAPRITERAPVAISDAEHAIVQPAPLTRTKRKPLPNRYGDYQPKTGSIPSRVLDALTAGPPGSCFSLAYIESHFGLPRKQFYGTFRTPIGKGALVELRISTGSRPRVVALPSSVGGPLVLLDKTIDLPARTTTPAQVEPQLHAISTFDPVEAEVIAEFLRDSKDALRSPLSNDAAAAIDASPEQLQACHALRLREAEARAWQEYVSLLQLRARMFRAARALPFPILPEPPALTSAA